MLALKVAVVGARPKSRGYNMGDFHAREFHRAGETVVGIANTSLESAAAAAEDLRQDFGINAKPYASLEELLKAENADIVIVATPPETHYKHIMTALNAGCHVLAEKPLCWNVSNRQDQIPKDAKYLFRTATKKRRVLAANHQLTALWNDYLKTFYHGSDYQNAENYHGDFALKLITKGISGKENDLAYVAMDLLPHALSFLVKILPGGSIRSAVESSFGESLIELKFTFGNGSKSVSSHLTLGYNPSAPEFSFGLDGYNVTRQIKKADADGVSYSLADSKGTSVNVGDPLAKFDRRFLLAAARNNSGLLLVKPEQELGVMAAQCQIMNYLSRQF